MRREKLPRGIRRRGDSLVVSFALADGTIERRSLGDVSESWAKEQRSIFQRQVREGKYEKKRPRVKATTTTIADLWKEYLRSYELAGKKAAWRQEAAWLHLKPTFEAMLPENLTTRDLTTYQETRKGEGAGPATINRELSALSAALFNAARMTGEGGKPLLAHVAIFPTKLREPAPRAGFIEQKQYETLMANAKPLWLRTLIATAYTFGFRRGELLNLCVGQVDFFGRWIELRQGETKNNDARKVAMTQEVFDLMRSCVRGKNPDDYVFTRENGDQVTDPRDDWQAACVASGLGHYVTAKTAKGEDYQKYVGLIIHSLRRAAVRNMLRRGVGEAVAMRIGGWRSASVARRYNITSEGDLQQATKLIEAGRKTPIAVDKTDTKTDTSSFSDTSAQNEISA